MKVREAIDRIDSLKHNTYTIGEKVEWLSQIDGIIKNNAEKASYYAMKTLRKVQKKVGFPERIR